MAITYTKAAQLMNEQMESITSHQIISLLMDGALERIDQGILALHANHIEDHIMLKEKLIAIINGLRNCLDFERGGEIASNLNELYLYMAERLDDTEGDAHLLALTEVRHLILEVKSGWDNMPKDIVGEAVAA
ncbi:MAG: flagellar protein FliS [Pseudomonadota bacterium]|jgi:flagellar protein FliS